MFGAAEKHPEADRLQVCQVDAGNGTMLQIVCGAPNARAGLVAPLATIGTRIGDITIKAAQLRGVESNGMLCSAKALGLEIGSASCRERVCQYGYISVVAVPFKNNK